MSTYGGMSTYGQEGTPRKVEYPDLWRRVLLAGARGGGDLAIFALVQSSRQLVHFTVVPRLRQWRGAWQVRSKAS